jgi:hypothetical protein
MIDVGASTLSYACICDLPCKNDLLDGIVQNAIEGALLTLGHIKKQLLLKLC